MMELRIIVFALFFGTITLGAQEKAKDETAALVSKGTFFAGLSSSFAFGFTMPEGNYMISNQLKPKIGYFLFDRLSVVLSHQTAGYRSSFSPRLRMFGSSELDLNYYFYAKKKLLIYSQIGVAYGNYHPITNKMQNAADLYLKLGGGISWGLKKLPNLRFNAEATYYLSPITRNEFQKIPHITFGLTYFFNRNKKTSKKIIDQ